MRRDELTELHYITPISNMTSILKHGLLSNRRVARLLHRSVAKPEIQNRRVKVVVPGGRQLHDYVKLYICARKPMMYSIQEQHQGLCVLRVNPAVLDIPGAIVADRNASTGYTLFKPVATGLGMIDLPQRYQQL